MATYSICACDLEERVDGEDAVDPVVLAELRRLS